METEKIRSMAEKAMDNAITFKDNTEVISKHSLSLILDDLKKDSCKNCKYNSDGVCINMDINSSISTQASFFIYDEFYCSNWENK